MGVTLSLSVEQAFGRIGSTKRIQDTGIRTHEREEATGGGGKCSSDMTSKGTEMDWLSFFYVVGTQTSNAYSLSNYWDVMFSSQVCNGGCTENDKVTWTNLAAGAAAAFSGNKLTHFVNNGSTYGVNH